MKNDNFSIESSLYPQQNVQFLEDKIYEHNSISMGRYDGNVFCKIVRDREGNIIAGIGGWTWDNISEITQLWVDKPSRGKGLGKMLLELAETEAKNRECHTVFVRSYSFQAPDFYVKFGYYTEHIINNFPKGHDYHFLIKRIVPT